MASNYLTIREEVRRRVSYAEEQAPRDPFTRGARWLTRGIQKGLKPVNYVIPYSTSLLKPVVGVPLLGHLYRLIVSVLWNAGYLLLLGSSWLWLRVAVVRPLLLVPLPILAMLGYLLMALLPETNRGTKYWRLALCDSWPLTWLLANAPLTEEQVREIAARERAAAKAARQARSSRRGKGKSRAAAPFRK